MNHLIRQSQLDQMIECDSAGTSSYHIGASPDRRMAAAARQKGIDLIGQARQFTVDDFEVYDWVLAMDRSNYQDILALDPAGRYRHKVKLMCEFCREFPDSEVPDPYYGGADGFTYVIDLLTDACGGLLDFVTSQSEG